ncbi:MAG: DUF4124 domain-containing protein [Acinetobacter populi]|jgi:hypothetical protein|uniref:DUF4124 domain-containing protein n=1 Tax=Acinetobacter populi TaxID=1582270 RepID=UPI0023540E73|nr:DUF4124 domain-containing protein [Acinetobacter populi]MCH4246452.1 DUF4124 domain-containing protein [Acinetobacter populi]
MSLQKKQIIHCVLGFFLFIPFHSYAQNFYKWVDANGSTHYTATPPPKNAKKISKVATYNDTPSGSSYIPPAKNANAEVPQQQTPSGNPTPANQNERIPLPPQQQNSGTNQPLIIQNNNTAL